MTKSPADITANAIARAIISERAARVSELYALRDAASRCDCGQECYCARNLEYAEAELEKLGVDPTKPLPRGACG